MKEGLRGENKEKEISQILRGRSFICVGVTSEQSMMGNYKWFEDRLIVQFLSFALLWSKFLWSLPISSKVCHIGYLCELGFYFFAFLVRCVLCVCVWKWRTAPFPCLDWFGIEWKQHIGTTTWFIFTTYSVEWELTPRRKFSLGSPINLWQDVRLSKSLDTVETKGRRKSGWPWLSLPALAACLFIKLVGFGGILNKQHNSWYNAYFAMTNFFALFETIPPMYVFLPLIGFNIEIYNTLHMVTYIFI